MANVLPWIRKPKNPLFTEGTLKSYKFVDDGVNSSKVNKKKATLLVEDGEFFKEIVDLRTQGHLEHMARRAEERGMAINAKKTGLMLVSAATSFKARVRVKLGGETVIESDSLKILGVNIDSDMSFKTHVQNIAAKHGQKHGPYLDSERKDLVKKIF